jgi:hypothetical protein
MAWVPPQQGLGTYATSSNFHHFRDTTLGADAPPTVRYPG